MEGHQTAIKWQSIQNTTLMHYKILVVENDITTPIFVRPELDIQYNNI